MGIISSRKPCPNCGGVGDWETFAFLSTRPVSLSGAAMKFEATERYRILHTPCGWNAEGGIGIEGGRAYLEIDPATVKIDPPEDGE